MPTAVQVHLSSQNALEILLTLPHIQRLSFFVKVEAVADTHEVAIFG